VAQIRGSAIPSRQILSDANTLSNQSRLWHGELVDGQLKAAPLREAIFELYADPEATTAWGADSKGRTLSRLPSYAFNEEHLFDVGIRIELGSGGTIQRQVPQERSRTWNEQGTKAVQFGSHMVALNILGPAYVQFEDHVDEMATVLRCYLEEARPSKIAWIGQRYINAIKVPVAETDVGSYFAIYPRLPADYVGHRPFALRLQTAATKNGAVMVSLSLEQVDASDATYTLDIYARSTSDVPNDIDAIRAWQVTIHEAVRAAFEHSTSPRLRDHFAGSQ